MIEFIIFHGHTMLWFFLTPVIGLLIDLYLPRKIKLISLLSFSILSLPFLLSYSYTTSILNVIILMFFISFLHSWILAKLPIRRYKIVVSSIIATALLVVLSICAFLSGLLGFKIKEKAWDNKNYRVEYLKNQGFAGGPLMTYELYQYGFNKILIKKLDVMKARDIHTPCIFEFENEYIIFDRCTGEIVEIED